MKAYQLTRVYRDSYDINEETVAFYETYEDAANQKRVYDLNSSNYEYFIYLRNIIPSATGDLK